MDLINREYIDDYLNELATYPQSQNMKDMANYAKANNIPIIRPTTAALLNVLIKTCKPKKILEIGTSIGYSGLVILKAIGEAGKLITVDIDENNIKVARDNFLNEGLLDQVVLICDDGGKVLRQLNESFDLIFLDGPKGQYLNYLPYCIKLLRVDGVLFCDDVLFYGMVAEDNLVVRRKITIVKRMRKFLDIISHHPQLDTSILSVGDGVSISIKKGEFIDEST